MSDIDLDAIRAQVAEALCVRTWGHDGDGVPCAACRKEAAILAGTFFAPLLSRLAEVEAERDAAKAEVSRFASLTPFSDGAMAILTAENARLRQQLAEDQTRDGQAWDDLVRERDEAQTRARRFEYEHDSTLDLVVKLTAAVNAMRPVVEAAEALAAVAEQSTAPRTPLFAAFIAAVDAYRAGPKAPETPLSGRQNDEQSEVIPEWERELLETQAAAEGEQIDRSSSKRVVYGHDGTGYAFPPLTKPATLTDPPGLDAAIEAANDRSSINGADWTVDPSTGHSNSSIEFATLCVAVERLIRDDAHTIMAGRADRTAALIVAQLAHKHEFGPAPALRAGALREAADEMSAMADRDWNDPDAPLSIGFVRARDRADFAAWLTHRADRIGGAT